MGINEFLGGGATDCGAHFEELLFWGRIEGELNDYYICMGVTYTD